MLTSSAFRPAWWLPGPHFQTLYPSLLRRRNNPPLQRERIELPDGDFIDLERTRQTDRPIVLILHGLEGSLESHYTGGILSALSALGFNAILMYFRGCSGEPNRLPRSYHSGDTGDLDYVVRRLAERFPGTAMAVIGYSLGGNVLLKWLGEQGGAAPVKTAIAVSVPFELDRAARRLEKGISRIYQAYLLEKLRRSATAKASLHPPLVAVEDLGKLHTFREFDNAITAPLHGFRDVDEYYARSSSRQFLHRILVPTLVIQARDDPFLPVDGLPAAEELSASVTLELAEHGGHVGFVSGWNPLRPRFWLEQRICSSLQDAFHSPALRTGLKT